MGDYIISSSLLDVANRGVKTFLKTTSDTDEFHKLMLIQDNATRWNSVDSIIDRAMKKRGDIEEFTPQ